MKEIYDELCTQVSIITTKTYSTSFSLGILFLDKSIRIPIYHIYGFVRVADEIVDSFHNFDKKTLLEEFDTEIYKSIERKISTNPILNSFQCVVNKYNINLDLIQSFMYSMKMDLEPMTYTDKEYEKYIYGSAEVVGLMCLKVFVNKEPSQYEVLLPYAKKLGSAFQKINFLRDLQADNIYLGRTYFPEVEISKFDENTKNRLLAEIEEEFKEALCGIKKLPKNARLGVYIAYLYYYELLNKIKSTPATKLLLTRIRISNFKKLYLLIKANIKYKFFNI